MSSPHGPTGHSPAPIFADAFRLCEYLLGRLGEHIEVLPHALCTHALAVFEAVTLALKDIDREHHIDAADHRLVLLRAELRLAEALGLLDDAQLLHALALADGIGRQLGGWQRHLEQA